MIELNTKNCFNNDVLEDVCENVYTDVIINVRNNVIINVWDNIRDNLWDFDDWYYIFRLDLKNHTKQI
jgi:hypothetical protein